MSGKTIDDLKLLEDEQIGLFNDIKSLLNDIKGLTSMFDSIFVPDESGLKIKKMYILEGKLKIKYEDGV